MDARTKAGVTAEGLPCEVTLYYEADAPEGALPERITGHYQAADGASTFEITREGDHYRSDAGETRVQPADLLPWVVAEGMW